ncbi:MAG: hypothetical protein IT212_07585 [Bacteroidia bacterium]|nr:hypothetical protein [Bacteroidia bacterium]
MPENKPPFNPNKPFTVVDGGANTSKPKFDPNKPFEVVKGGSIMSDLSDGFAQQKVEEPKKPVPTTDFWKEVGRQLWSDNDPNNPTIAQKILHPIAESFLVKPILESKIVKPIGEGFVAGQEKVERGVKEITESPLHGTLNILGGGAGMIFNMLPAATAFTTTANVIKAGGDETPYGKEIGAVIDAPFTIVSKLSGMIGYKPEEDSNGALALELFDLVAGGKAIHIGGKKLGLFKDVQEAVEKVAKKETTPEENRQLENGLKKMAETTPADIVKAAMAKGTPEAMEIVRRIAKAETEQQGKPTTLTEKEKGDMLYELAKKEGIEPFKQGMEELAAKGDLSVEELADNTNRLNSYQKYWEQVKDKDFSDGKNKTVFDLTWKADQAERQVKALEKKNADPNYTPNTLDQITLDKAKEAHKAYKDELIDVLDGKKIRKEEVGKITPEQSKFVVDELPKIKEKYPNFTFAERLEEANRRWEESKAVPEQTTSIAEADAKLPEIPKQEVVAPEIVKDEAKAVEDIESRRSEELKLNTDRTITNDLIEKVLPEFGFEPSEYLKNGEYDQVKIGDVFDQIEKKINEKYDTELAKVKEVPKQEAKAESAVVETPKLEDVKADPVVEPVVEKSAEGESKKLAKTKEVPIVDAKGNDTGRTVKISISDKRVKLKESEVTEKGNAKTKTGGLNFEAVKAMKHEVSSARDQVLQYFIGGGRIHERAIQELLGGVGKDKAVESEAALRKGYLSKKPLREGASAIEDLAHKMWQSQKVKGQYDTTHFRDAIESVIKDNNTKSKMARELNDKMREADLQDAEAYMGRIEDVERPLTKEEKKAADDWQKEWDEKLKENLNKPDQFQKAEGKGTETSAERKAKVEQLKKAMPKVKVVEDATLGEGIAGVLETKEGKQTVKLNPEYNRTDTAIHEFGHALIDMMGGTANKFIAKGIEQLKGTELWKRVEKTNPELSPDMLAKEVLATAIGKEGALVWVSKAGRSAIRNWVDMFLNKVKRVLGIENNVARSLAKELLGGKEIKGEGKGVEGVQKQKLSESDADAKFIADAQKAAKLGEFSRDNLKEKASTKISQFNDLISKTFASSSTALKNIDESLKAGVRTLGHNIEVSTQKSLSVAKPFLEKVDALKKINKEDFNTLAFALKNRNKPML